MTKTYDSANDKASYGIGRQMGGQLAAQSLDGLSPTAVAEGVIDALTGAASAVSDQDLHAAFQELEQKMKAKAAEQGAKLAGEGLAFLETNAQREEVTVLESGLQYEVLHSGSGEVPTANSTVKTHYHGTLISGEVFDSSVERGQPAEFPVKGVIPGWTEALQLMSVGTKWRLFVPPHLAYGERGAGGKIGPNSTLIFDVELIDIVA